MSKKSKSEMNDELRPEYDLSKMLKKSVRGKYAAQYQAGTNLVLLEPDVAKAFPSEKEVNEALRWVMQLTKIQRSRKRSPAKA